ncbi:bifunctional DNA primase/polymerase [Companilactobacillus allii]|uniref:DNA primase n=1 Tax=Companilactobacillus allii TaxID=1847728 RepID=A0A1P8Q5J4_9LACO|nr:bifunctional DNA primase/polymerase [Companilactobacillus allii]APX73132.1 DNA primase [Companilactobacillus allii]USQ67936.1 bifunctional DNA primase/polymerase [Companilactobacillus allii]
MQNLVNYAAKYAEKGLSVLPMLNKRPLIEFADSKPMKSDEVRRVWKQFPFAQIAVRTIDLFVIDIDTKEAHGHDGFKSIDEYEHKDLLIPTLEQETSSGGRQLIYFKRKDMSMSQHIAWLPGVDVKAHNNNYFMIAPSEVKGKKYKWLNHNPIVTPSKELIELINKKEYKSTNSYIPGQTYTTDKTATSNLFEQIVNGFGETGGRNSALTSFVGGLLFRNVEVSTAYELAKQANENTPKSLPPKEFENTFNSMLEKEMKRRKEIEEIGKHLKK